MNTSLFILVTFIWGSTWLAIRYQLDGAHPLASVTWRFFLASFLVFGWCVLRRLPLRYGVNDHLFFALQGVFMFGVNYWIVYDAEQSLSSGLVAVIFSVIIFFNVINGALFLKSPVRVSVVSGGLVGLTGLVCVFYEQIAGFDFARGGSRALLLCLLASLFASLGNITSAYNQKQGRPVMQTNAWGMLYGAISMLLAAIVTHTPLTVQFSISYAVSFLYLVVFGSIVAFTAYLKLLGNIGPSRSSYVTLVFPVIALGLSTVFESYIWTPLSIIGVLIILSGNFLVLQERSKS